MKTFFEEPVIRVESFTAESVMLEDGYGFNLLSGIVNLGEDETKAINIFSKPY